jgi:H+/gluconate symporter-like permease
MSEADDARMPVAGTAQTPLSLGGWLILPAIGLVFSPLGLARGLITDLGLVGQLSTKAPTLSFLLLVEACAYAALALWCVKVAIDFFKRRRSTRNGFIALSIASIVFLILDLVAGAAFGGTVEPSDGGRILAAIIASGIWISYFMRSERVKRTFLLP